MKITINRNALKAVSRFQAVKDIRYYLNGMFIEASATKTRLVATDGKVLGLHQSNAGNDVEGVFSCIIPSEAVKAMLAWKLTKSIDWTIDLSIYEVEGKPEIRAESAGNAIIFKPVDGTFPNYRQIIPAEVSGDAAYINPEFLVRVKDACNDLHTGKSEAFPEMGFNGETGAALLTWGDEFVAVVMPLRHELQKGDMGTAWAKGELPTAKQEVAVPEAIAA